MARVRSSILRSLYTSINPSRKMHSIQSYDSCMNFTKYADHTYVRPSFAYINQNNYHTTAQSMGVDSPLVTQCYKRIHVDAFSPTMSNLRFRSSTPVALMSPMLNCRSYLSSSFFGGKGNESRGSEVPSASGVGKPDDSDSGVVGTDLLDKVKDAFQVYLNSIAYAEQKVKEAFEVLTHDVQGLLHSHPYLNDVIIPVGCTLTGTILAWLVMPRILRKFHKYAIQRPGALLSFGEQVPYEKSFWSALEDPVRYLITFMAFSQIGMMVAPTTIASQYIAPAWRGAVILSFVWFLHRWKTNVFARALVYQSLAGLDREKLLALDKVSSVGLFVIGLMALAEACGVAVQSILTVGGIGGVATAFASKDILGNVLSGLSMQFSKPFSLGDTIKAGSVEGQVVEMGLTTTSLLNAEKFPVIVPNSLFSSQVIVNKSRAQWRAIVNKIPLQIDDLDKITRISDDIRSMLETNPKIFLGKEAPYCFLSHIESSYAELTLGCNLKHMNKGEFYSTQQDILLQSVQIIKQNGGKLGSTVQDLTGPSLGK